MSSHDPYIIPDTRMVDSSVVVTDPNEFVFPVDDDDHVGNSSYRRGVETTATPASATATSKCDDNMSMANGISWLTQMKYMILKKNIILLSRYPVMLFFMTISSVLSVILAWFATRRKEDLINSQQMPPLDNCGTIEYAYLANISNHNGEELWNLPVTMNDAWVGGTPIVYVSLGPFVLACCVFLIVHDEISLNLYEVIVRGLSVFDSVYWLSWYFSFGFIAMINSLLGSFVAKVFVSINVTNNTYFGGLFASIFLLHLALISASLLLASLAGTKKRVITFIVMIMFTAVWIPRLYFAISQPFPTSNAADLFYTYTPTDHSDSPSALFWMYRSTIKQAESAFSNDTFSATCDVPIMSNFQGHQLKSLKEQKQVRNDEFFVGCYASAGIVSTSWDLDGMSSTEKFFMTILYANPYFQFAMIWGNFLGVTSLPGSQFKMQHANIPPEQLASTTLATLPLSSSTASTNNTTTTMLPQGSTINVKSVWFDYEGSNDCTECSTCPDSGRSGFNFCESTARNICRYAKNDGSAQATTIGKSVSQLLFQLLLQSIVYLALAAYFGIAFIGTGSAVNHWYFPCRPRYWFPNSRKKKHGGSGDTNIGEDVRNENEDDACDGVFIQSVTKVFGCNEAVKNISLHLKKGEVTALLGHNGAGKTTLSHILCCEQSVSKGDATVFGHSVSEDPRSVRKIVGICKQDNYLWPNMSAREHLELFAGLRGVHPTEAPSIVLKWLESVDLDSVQDQPTSSFSGGMKRRLSLCLATVGHTQKFIILDEPTTGMDPVSRRFVWRHIDEVKDDRVILLTTHAMEEADLLSDMVAIMKRGELVAWGSPLELKCEHGTALQFTILINRDEIESAVQHIRSHFMSEPQWVEVRHSEAGNITVTVKKVREVGSTFGVDVDDLTRFVSWLQSPTSNVLEFGFSNSSLEEVFLKVTEGEVASQANHQQDQPPQLATIAALDDMVNIGNSTSMLPSYKPKLATIPQIRALVFHWYQLNWNGSRSIPSWLIYGLIVLISTVCGCRMPLWGYQNQTGGYTFPLMTLTVFFLTPILISITSTLYWDRNEGLQYYMQCQGLLQKSFLGGISVYSFLVYFLYSFVLLTFLFFTPGFRAPTICSNTDATLCERGTFDPPSISISYLNPITNDGENAVFGYLIPSGYEKIFVTIVAFSLTGPGAVLVSSFLPGHKFALVFIGFSSLVATIVPLSLYIRSLVRSFNSMSTTDACMKQICDLSELTSNNATAVDLNCIGWTLMDKVGFCTPAVISLLPQMGLFQLLGISLSSRIQFVSDSDSFSVEDFVRNNMDSAHCKGTICDFPYAKTLFWSNVLYMILGGIVMLVFGLSSGLLFSTGKRLTSRLQDMLSNSCMKREHQTVTSFNDVQHEELDEVIRERITVTETIKPFLATFSDDATINNDVHISDHSVLPRESLPPILTYKLRKVYPSLGGILPPKVALASLDLHIPKGQVLGLLGKNGAGKTTAFKILSNAHEATSGIALVSGYDTSCEKLAVFENLGNCPQFDVFWPTLTVAEHLEFFGRLKGLSRVDARDAALAMANAVGLGNIEVFTRQAKSLSGGMRRRLSLASALLCSPSVVLLDEPTTGLDPSTRNSIWNLISSFRSENRSIIITTHMMIEADTLCDRIAIVSKGRLKVVESQQYLKDTYGSGYLLQLNLSKNTLENEVSAMSFVRNHINPDAIVQTKQAKTIHIKLPRDLDLQRVFGALYNQEIRPDSINQFLLSQSSLEDVFIALGSD